MATGDDLIADEVEIPVELATDLIVRRVGPIVVDGVTIEDHSARHEDGGADEINVGGLSGTLADPQTPTAHASTHEDGGSDEINVGGLSGELADPQPPKAHASTHSDGGSDEITVEDLATGSVNTAHVLKPDGAGGLVMGPAPSPTGLLTKEAGKVSTASFASTGSPSRKRYTLSFAETYTDAIPTLTWDRDVKATFTVESVGATSMVIVASTNGTLGTGDVYYHIMEAGSET